MDDNDRDEKPGMTIFFLHSRRKLLIHPHEQQQKKQLSVSPKAIHTCNETWFQKYIFSHHIMVEASLFFLGSTKHLYLNTVRRQGADRGGSIGCVRPRSHALLCKLMSSWPQLGEAAARVRFELPARNQVGIQTCWDEKRKWGHRRPIKSFSVKQAQEWIKVQVHQRRAQQDLLCVKKY